MQIHARDLVSYKKYKQGINIVAIYGGASIVDQMKEIKPCPNRSRYLLVVSIDVIERKAFTIDRIKYITLDEVDEMLNMGFREDIEYVLLIRLTVKSLAVQRHDACGSESRFQEIYVQPGGGHTGNCKCYQYSHRSSVFHGNSYDRYEALNQIDFYRGIYGIILHVPKSMPRKSPKD